MNKNKNNKNSFFPFQDNNILSALNEEDKYEFLLYLKTFFLEYQNQININKNYTFGTEIEFEDIVGTRDRLELDLYTYYPDYSWIIKDDITLYKGAEINSPIMKDYKKYWAELKEICLLVQKYAIIGPSSSSHIHVGMHILGNNPIYWRNFFLLWMTYENVIYRFFYGEYLSHRKTLPKYAPSISKKLMEQFDFIDKRSKDIISGDNHYNLKNIFDFMVKGTNSFKGLNLLNITTTNINNYNTVANKNTIEVRCPNGTLNPIIWQNNINFIIHLLEYAKNPNFNEDIINKRLMFIKEHNLQSSLNSYANIYIDEAFELADLIFNDNKEKIYFLRQYYKNGEVVHKPMIKSKRFTK